MSPDQSVIVTAKDLKGETAILLHRAGMIVPGPAWWVRLSDGTETLFDEEELEPQSDGRGRCK